MYYIFAFITIIVAYLIGSINFAVIFSKAYGNVDVRDYGSGNAGTTNVMRVAGAVPGILTFVLDALKGCAAALLGFFIFKLMYDADPSASAAFNPVYGKFICGLACIIGHCWPVFFQFRGGKAAATSIGIFAVCCPMAIIIGLAAFAVCVILSRIVSLSSLVATVVVVAATIYSFYYNYKGVLYYGGQPVKGLIISIIAVVCGIIIFLRHKDNIVRLIHGKEKKLSIKRSR